MNTDSEKQISQLVVNASKYWGKIKYYRQLVEISVEPENYAVAQLYQEAYVELSKSYHNKLDSTLQKLRELTSGRLELE